MPNGNSQPGIQPLASTSPIQHTESAPFNPAVTDHSQEGPDTTPTAPATVTPVTKQPVGDESGGSDSGQDVRSPASVVQDQTINSSSPTSHQSNTSSGFGDGHNNLTLSSQQQHQPFLSYTGQPFYQHQYGYVPLDMSGYAQYQNIYSNQG